MIHRKRFTPFACLIAVAGTLFLSSFPTYAAVVDEDNISGMEVEDTTRSTKVKDSGGGGGSSNNNNSNNDNSGGSESESEGGSSSGSVKFDNDGNARDNPYGDAKFTNSYEGADYYDCYVPYNLTCEEVGGYATGVSATLVSSENYGMSGAYENRRQWKFSERITLYKSVAGKSWYSPATCSVDPETGIQILQDTNGAKYYTTAIQDFFYMFPGAAADKGFRNQNNCIGQLVDVVLTDGTVIHFVINDNNSCNHCNGGPPENPLWEVQYIFSDLKLSQYKNIYQAANGNMLELGYDTSQGYEPASKFRTKYKLGSGNMVAYYRMYNKEITNPPKRASGVGNEVSYSLGSVSISASGGGDSSDEEVGVSNSKVVSEWELAGMPTMSEVLANQTALTLPTRDDLSVSDQYNVSSIKESIELTNKATAFERARVLVVFIGLLLELYGVLLFVSMLLDRVNAFVDIRLVSVLSFGQLQYIDDDDVELREGMTNTKKLVFSVLAVMAVGMFLISGSIFPALGRLVYTVSQQFI